MKIIAATLKGPEPEPFWPFVRAKAAIWADDHVIVEDPNGEAWGDEFPFRKRLWDEAVEAAGDDGWVFVLDSDFVVAGNPKVLADSSAYVGAWAFDLYDLWSWEHRGFDNLWECSCEHDDLSKLKRVWHYRDDRYWQAHRYPRPWMFRASAFKEHKWLTERGIHTGHYPWSKQEFTVSAAPSQFAILHLGWLPTVRAKKLERYRSVWDKLLDQEKAHVESINDPNPHLVELPSRLAVYLDGLNP